MLRTALVALLVLHCLIHGLGVAKAFGWAEVSALTKTIGRPLGVVWGMAGALFVLAAEGEVLRRRGGILDGGVDRPARIVQRAELH